MGPFTGIIAWKGVAGNVAPACSDLSWSGESRGTDHGLEA